MLFNENFKNRFRELVDTLEMTKTKCANVIGISYQTFIDIYAIGKVPYVKQLLRIADYFDVSLDYLLGRTDKRERT